MLASDIDKQQTNVDEENTKRYDSTASRPVNVAIQADHSDDFPIEENAEQNIKEKQKKLSREQVENKNTLMKKLALLQLQQKENEKTRKRKKKLQ